jgi:hypothetical protein
VDFAASDGPLQTQLVAVGVFEEELLHAEGANDRASRCNAGGAEGVAGRVQVLAADIELGVAVGGDAGMSKTANSGQRPCMSMGMGSFSAQGMSQVTETQFLRLHRPQKSASCFTKDDSILFQQSTKWTIITKD